MSDEAKVQCDQCSCMNCSWARLTCYCHQASPCPLLKHKCSLTPAPEGLEELKAALARTQRERDEARGERDAARSMRMPDRQAGFEMGFNDGIEAAAKFLDAVGLWTAAAGVRALRREPKPAVECRNDGLCEDHDCHPSARGSK